MMKQSRLMSFLESCGNTFSGFLLSLFFQWVILVMLKGLPMTWQDNLEFAVLMTIVSIARSFGWRRLMEALHVRNPLSPGAVAIIAERRRQIEVEGRTLEHDAKLSPGELERAGACYALHGLPEPTITLQIDNMQVIHIPVSPEKFWDWDRQWWKPADHRRNLIKSGALILAALDRDDYVRNRKSRGAAQ